MSKLYIRWHMNPLTVPMNPEERVKLWITMLENAKRDVEAGVFSDWAMCTDVSAGYCTSDLDPVKLHTASMKYMPHIVFDTKPVMTVDETIESLKKAVAAAKPK
jgi:hypothetical protein